MAAVPVTTGLAALIAAADHPDSAPLAGSGLPRHGRRRRRRDGRGNRI
ncbi:hypothetical protein OG618_08620 [Kitasatospora sp. NBC_01246]|nr:hypothetical protein [Kitasatospora sp. NBC_01246]